MLRNRFATLSAQQKAEIENALQDAYDFDPRDPAVRPLEGAAFRAEARAPRGAAADGGRRHAFGHASGAGPGTTPRVRAGAGRHAAGRLVRRQRDPHPRSRPHGPGRAVPDHLQRALGPHPHRRRLRRPAGSRRGLERLRRRHRVHLPSARGRDLPQRRPAHRRRRRLHLQPLQGPRAVVPQPGAGQCRWAPRRSTR